jgi:hypothetical protein
MFRDFKYTLNCAIAAMALCVSIGADSANAKECTKDDIATLAKRGFSKSDIDKVCGGGGGAAASPLSPPSPLSELISAVVKVSQSGAADLAKPLFDQGKWPLNPTVSSRAPGYEGKLQGWRIFAEKHRLTVDMKFPPDSTEIDAKCAELKLALQTGVTTMAQPLVARSEPFRNEGSNMYYGSEVNMGMIDGKLRTYLGCHKGSVMDYGGGNIKKRQADVTLSIESNAISGN